ncbi:MAG: DUF1659 domain-containing protein [Synergistaceae bacterium]|jgi:hypothetical protein|nr:DUF1659 domain-containing protein [Synergistaceae bacterium]
MASIVTQPGRIVFKLDTGEMNGDKAVYRNLSIGGVKGDAQAGDLADAASEISGLVDLPVAEISLQRTEILEI